MRKSLRPQSSVRGQWFYSFQPAPLPGSARVKWSRNGSAGALEFSDHSTPRAASMGVKELRGTEDSPFGSGVSLPSHLNVPRTINTLSNIEINDAAITVLKTFSAT